MSKVAVYVGEQKLFASEGYADIFFDSGTIEVHDGGSAAGTASLGILFVYIFRPGQYAKIKTVNGVKTVNINE